LPLEAGHLDDLSVTIETPAMERTNNAVAAHPPSYAEVSAEVWTMCVEDPDGAILPSERDEISIQVVQGFDFTEANLVGSSDTEPAVGSGRERVPGIPHVAPSFLDVNRPAKVRNGRSALVTQPGGASTTARIALSAGMPVMVIPTEAKASGDEKSVPGFGKIMCLL
jgi:hypothetical protein